MKRWIILCVALALFQTGLTVATHRNGQDGDTKIAKGSLLSIQAATINGLLLENDKGQQLRMDKVGEQWLLPASDNFPADNTRVQALLDKLINLQRGWPEATTAEAASRFKVADNGFAHKLTLLQDGKTTNTIYFGTSPGLRKLYLRVDKEVEIHSLTLTAQDLEPKAESWIDTTVLHLKPEHIVRVHLPGLVLERTKDGLQPVGLKEGEKAIKERLDALVNRLTQLTISNILGKEDKAEYGLDTPALQYSIDLDGGTTISYTFGQPPQAHKVEGKNQEENKDSLPPVLDKDFVLKVSSQEQFLQVDGWQMEELKKANRASLITKNTQKETISRKDEVLPQATQPPPAQQELSGEELLPK